MIPEEHSIQDPDWRCPVCHAEPGDTDEEGIEDDYYYYAYTCPECGCEFTQWYKLEYAETTYRTGAEVEERRLKYEESRRQWYEESNKKNRQEMLELVGKLGNNLSNECRNIMLDRLEDPQSYLTGSNKEFNRYEVLEQLEAMVGYRFDHITGHVFHDQPVNEPEDDIYG